MPRSRGRSPKQVAAMRKAQRASVRARKHRKELKQLNEIFVPLPPAVGPTGPTGPTGARILEEEAPFVELPVGSEMWVGGIHIKAIWGKH